MWNAKATVIPEIVGASGTISESLRQYLSSIHTSNARNQGTTKTAILDTANILESANVKVKSYSTCCITLCVAQTVNS